MEGNHVSNTALITGITGQDGSYLAEVLLEKGYEVHGVVRRASTPNTSRINHLEDRITLHGADLIDLTPDGEKVLVALQGGVVMYSPESNKSD